MDWKSSSSLSLFLLTGRSHHGSSQVHLCIADLLLSGSGLGCVWHTYFWWGCPFQQSQHALYQHLSGYRLLAWSPGWGDLFWARCFYSDVGGQDCKARSILQEGPVQWHVWLTLQRPFTPAWAWRNVPWRRTVHLSPSLCIWKQLEPCSWDLQRQTWLHPLNLLFYCRLLEVW